MAIRKKTYKIATIELVAAQLKWAKENNFSTSVLLGSGMSVSAGIPTAEGIINEIRSKFPKHVSMCKDNSYSSHMEILNPLQKKQIISSFIDKAKVNAAHIYLGSLIKDMYIDRILTTNFDPLIIWGLALFNIFPAVYDLATSNKFIPGGAADISVFYLHGQRDGFVQLNTEMELNSHYKNIKPVFQDVSRKRFWLIVGYSGECDPVFQHLSEIDLQSSLFWVGYKFETPKKHILKGILEKFDHSYYVNGHDADSFFNNLVKYLRLPQPDIINRPFSYLKGTTDKIQKSQYFSNLQTFDKYIDISSDIFQDGKGFKEFHSIENDLLSEEELIQRMQEIRDSKQYAQADSLYYLVTNKNNAELKKQLSYVYDRWGRTLIDSANDKSYSSAIELYTNAIGKYEIVLTLRPDDYEALFRWESVLLKIAYLKGNAYSENLEEMAIEKFEKAYQLNSNYNSALEGHARALIQLATKMGLVNSDELIKQSFCLFEKALPLSNNKYITLTDWGNAIIELTHYSEKEEIECYTNMAMDLFNNALLIKQDYLPAINGQGICLSNLSRLREGREKEELLEKSLEKYLEALALKHDTQYIIGNKCSALLVLAKLKNKEKCEVLLLKTMKEYQVLLDINPNSVRAINGLGVVFLELSRIREGKVANELLNLALENFDKCEEMQPGYSSYNKACVYSLRKNIPESIKWLELSRRNNYPPKWFILADDKMDNIIKTEEFMALFN